MLGGASSYLAHMRYLRCVECERVWRDTYWFHFEGGPPRGWTTSLGTLLACLDEAAREDCYSP